MSRTAPALARHRHLLAAAAAFAVASVVVLQASDAAFTADFTNEANEFSTGTIDLDGDYTAPLFGDTGAGALANGLGLKPGDVTEACILITYTDTLTDTALTPVELAVGITDDADDLARHLQVAVAVEDDCGASPTYAGPTALRDVPSATGWTPDASGESRGFHFQVTVGADAPQGATASGIDLTWSVSTTS
jgi:hypothetical protein